MFIREQERLEASRQSAPTLHEDGIYLRMIVWKRTMAGTDPARTSHRENR